MDVVYLVWTWTLSFAGGSRNKLPAWLIKTLNFNSCGSHFMNRVSSWFSHIMHENLIKSHPRENS